MICSGEEFDGRTNFSWHIKKYDSSDGFTSIGITIERVFEVIHSLCLESNGFEYLRKDFLVSLNYLTRL